jgi:aminoglycoside 3-N-acetyltransferase
MRIFARKVLSKFLHGKNRAKAKKIETKLRKYLVSKFPELDEYHLRDILVRRLGIRAGNHIFVHSSLVDRIRTNVRPHELLNIILEIIGSEGSVSVPTFPSGFSKELMKTKKPFDVKRTPSGMGLLSECVRRHKGSKRSLHPTKSVATIGKIADSVLSEHHLSDYEFGSESPLVKLLEYDVKIIGIGVPMSYLSLVNTVEDCYPDEFPIAVHEPGVYEKMCISAEGEEHMVHTRVRDLRIMARANPERFVRKFLRKEAYTIYRYYLSPFFSVNGRELFDELRRQMRLGNTIYD